MIGDLNSHLSFLKIVNFSEPPTSQRELCYLSMAVWYRPLGPSACWEFVAVWHGEQKHPGSVESPVGLSSTTSHSFAQKSSFTAKQYSLK